MKISSEKLTISVFLILILFAIFNGLIVIEPLRSLVSLVVVFVVPGYLLLFLLRANVHESIQRGLFALGLSLLFLMVCGLATNTIGTFFHLPEPLSRVPMLVTISSVLGILAIANYIRNHGKNYRISIPRFRVWQIGMYLLPPLLTLMAVFGATLLNNFLGNELILTMLGGVGLVYIFLIIFSNRLPNGFIFWSIYWLSLSLLLMTSLRGAYATGHDIQREYYVMELTKAHYTWSMALYQDAYNACLSITILPTVISDFVTIGDVYIYKLLFQMIFACVPVMVYLITRQLVRKQLALACVILFSAFPTFMNDMAFLNRQEIGFIYFGLMLLLILKPTGQKRVREILFVAFGVGMVLAHYSTSYLTIALLCAIFIEGRLIAVPFIRKLLVRLRFSRVIQYRYFLKWQHLLLIMSALVFWNILITKTAGSFFEVAQQTIDDLLYSTTSMKSSDVGYSLINSAKLSDEQLVALYYQTALNAPERKAYPQAYYSDQIVAQYPLHAVSKDQIPLTPFGNLLTRFHIDVLGVNTLTRTLIANGLQLLLMIGVLVVIVFKKRSYPLDLFLITGTGIFFSALMLVLPTVSVQYGLLRLFQQMLFVFSVFIVLGLAALFRARKSINSRG